MKPIDSKPSLLSLLVVLLFAFMTPGCSEDEECPPTAVCPPDLTYEAEYAWDCAISVSCQDVFDIEFVSETVATIAATGATGGSVLQIALYSPGVPLGGTNLFTGSANEYRCGYISGCANNEQGQWITDFPIPSAGTYRLAVTRYWGDSCGGSGTYKLTIISNKAFAIVAQSVNDEATLAPGWDCP